MYNTYFILEENKIFIYIENNKKLSLKDIDGYEYFEYSYVNQIESLVQYLFGEFNISSPSDIAFNILENVDKNITKNVQNVLLEYNSNVNIIYLKDVAIKAINSLKNDTSLEIDAFGINIYNINFKMMNKQVSKSDFNLLAYTLNDNIKEFLL